MASIRLLSPAVGGLVLFVTGLWLVKRSLGRLSPPTAVTAAGLPPGGRAAAVISGAAGGLLAFCPLEVTGTLATLCRVRLVSLRRAVAAGLGFPLAAALFAQLIAFDPGAAATYVMAAALVAQAVFSRGAVRSGARAVLGGGFLFFGLRLAESGVQDIFAFSAGSGLARAVESLAHNPFHLFAAALLFTALVRSPVVTVAVAMVLGLGTEAGVAAVLGAAVGACVPAAAASLFRGVSYRRLGFANLITNLLAASFVLAMLGPFTRCVVRVSAFAGAASQERVLANAYLIFALVTAAIFIPLVPAVEQIAISLGGGSPPEAREVLEPSRAHEPQEALEGALAHVAAAGRQALDLLRKSLSAYLVDARGMQAVLESGRREFECRRSVLEAFIRKIDDAGLSQQGRETKVRLWYVLGDICEIFRIITGALARPAARMTRRGLEFSTEQAHNFESLHRLVSDDLAESLDLLEGRPARSGKVRENEAKVERLRQEISSAHARRAAAGVEADKATSAHFLAALAALRNIHFHVFDIARLAEAKA